MKFTRTAFVAAAAFALATVATAASAAPFAKHIGGDTTTIQVKGGHGHGGHGTFGGATSCALHHCFSGRKPWVPNRRPDAFSTAMMVAC